MKIHVLLIFPSFSSSLKKYARHIINDSSATQGILLVIIIGIRICMKLLRITVPRTQQVEYELLCVKNIRQMFLSLKRKIVNSSLSIKLCECMVNIAIRLRFSHGHGLLSYF